MAIDRADWHSGADDFPEDAPEENGAAHIGWFVRWAIGRGLFANEESGTPEQVIEAVRSGTMSGRDLVLEHLDGKLWESDLTEEGQAFAEAHYNEYLRELGAFSVDEFTTSRIVRRITGRWPPHSMSSGRAIPVQAETLR